MNHPGFFKRLLVVIYDALLLAGVILVAYVPVYLLLSLFPESVQVGMIGNFIKGIYLLGITFFFYGWFWTHGGQTLGMRAWRLYLIKPDGKFPNWPQAALRYISAIGSWGFVPLLLWVGGVKFWYLTIGLGFTWMLLTPARQSWHDILSNTRIVNVPPKNTLSKKRQQKIKS